MKALERKPPTLDEVGGENVSEYDYRRSNSNIQQTPQQQSKLDIALNLVRHGFRVFRLKPFGTEPLVEKWFYEHTTDEEAIRELWAGDNADCNIGLSTAYYTPMGKECYRRRSLIVIESFNDDDRVAGNGNPIDGDIIISKPTGGAYSMSSTNGLASPANLKIRNVEYPAFRVHGAGGYIVAPGSETTEGKYELIKNNDNWRANPSDGWGITFIDPPRTPDYEGVADGEDDFDGYIPDLADRIITEKGESFYRELLTKRCLFELSDLYDHELQAFRDDCRVILGLGDTADKPTPTNGNALPIRLFGEIAPKAPDELVQGMLVAGTMSVLYGDSNVGKSFFALYLALCVARGSRFYDRQVKQGLVAYIAAEGGASMERRFAAAKQEYGDDALPLVLVPSAIDLRTADTDADRLIAAIHQAELQTGNKAVLVVIDTLARALAGGDENSPAAMGAFVGQVDRIREQTGAHILVIHHSGKDKARGARGHSSLKAAIDSEIEITADDKNDMRRANVTKQRDGAVGEDFVFNLQEVVVEAPDGKFTTCIVEPVERDDVALERLSGAQVKALAALDAAVVTVGDPVGWVKVTEWRKHCKLSNGTKDAEDKAFARARDKLQERHLIEVKGAKVRRKKA